MSALEQLFASAELDVVIPDTSIEYPPATPADDWLSRLKSETLERTQAFFDEQLQALLTVRIEQPSTSTSRDAAHPPKDLLVFLSHLQISLEATYISSVPVGSSSPETPRTARLSAPPRTASLAKLNARSAHPPIFPPNTPNPTPSSAETDKRYLKSEGTLLLASIWGQNSSEDSQEGFSLLWSEEEEMWVVVYRLALTVSFLRLAVSDPLLCLTVSATLRDRPQTFSRANHPLALFLASVDFLPSATAPASPTSPTAANGISATDAPPPPPTLSGLPEINLLEGLAAGPAFNSAALSLPTARLGSVSRLKLFTLPALPPRTPLPAPSMSPMTATGRSQVSSSGAAPATLRKSFRKTLRTVSGFRVRMRTVFVPSVLLPLTGAQSTDEETDEERDRLEAGTDERTVVLCVELENSGESGRMVGFEVEKVDVKVGGGDDAGARAVLVGWGNEGGKDNGSVFPMRVGASEQYNLLYAVSFLRSPDEALAMGLIKDSGAQEMLQRAVTIGIFGRPYLASSPSSSSSSPPTTPTAASSSSSGLSYPTNVFCSKWNCVLDLSSQPHPEPEDVPEDGDFTLTIPSVLPEPASPFPSAPRIRPDSMVSIPRDSPPPFPTPQTANPTKRHTLPGGQPIVAARALGMKTAGPNKNYRASTSMLNPLNSAKEQVPPVPPLPLRSSSFNNTQYTPPSQTAVAQMPRSPTTYATPPRLQVDLDYQSPIPMTPAYPAYPTRSAAPPTPPGVMAASHTQGVGAGPMGRSVEIRRERGMAMGIGAVGVPPTPGPVVSVGGGVGGGFFGLGASASESGGFREEDEYEHEGRGHDRDEPGAVRSGEAIVVSVGLVASGVRRLGGNLGKTLDGKQGDELHRIYPLDRFTLDVFVFNQSEWTRRFEVTCPDRRRGRGRSLNLNPGEKTPSPGIVPLDNRVRIGPLLPAACQSVRMEFLAVTPGVHSITTLTLTDVESGYSMNLRSVMDIVVHEPGDV
ncbi:TRAPP trafficking subunit Trs65-domain-containing protein [Mycena haematopus]|nr:TRAPP trafficking subunit Trs65-domain-containing protein [Mycena haematopus]